MRDTATRHKPVGEVRRLRLSDQEQVHFYYRTPVLSKVLSEGGMTLWSENSSRLHKERVPSKCIVLVGENGVRVETKGEGEGVD